jgi:formylglycine-generating enzyme
MRKFILLFAFSAMFLMTFACSEESTKPTLAPNIIEISPDVCYIDQKITIYGEHFGYGDIQAKIVFDSTIFVNKENCLKWNNSLIELHIPKGVSTGEIYIMTGQDTSNTKMITVNRLPPFTMILIPGGIFDMGSESGSANEMPVHSVRIDSLYAAEFEVTQLLWKSVMDDLHEEFIGNNYPVANVGWYMAVDFCNKLSYIQGFDTCYSYKDSEVLCDFDANGYRLPTEAEWEYLCRAGTTGDYSGNDLSSIAWFAENSGFNRHPVGTKQPNPFGIYDMHGNLWEWCWDWFDENYYEVSPEDNPQGPLKGTEDVIRGGSYADDIFYLRSANRTFPHADSSLCGFRIVRKATK